MVKRRTKNEERRKNEERGAVEGSPRNGVCDEIDSVIIHCTARNLRPPFKNQRLSRHVGVLGSWKVISRVTPLMRTIGGAAEPQLNN